MVEHAKKGELNKLFVHETPVGFYLCAELSWKPSRLWYLTTKLDRYTPRIFKDLHRLHEFIDSLGHNLDEYVIRRHQELPKPDKEAVKPQSAKAYRKLMPKNAARHGEKVKPYNFDNSND